VNKTEATKAAVMARMALSGVPSFKDLADLAGLTQRTMYHWITSPRNTDTLDAVAIALRTSSAELLQERDRLMGQSVADAKHTTPGRCAAGTVTTKGREDE
jgi:hypothetical protein|tara:strand:+ start:610 stop:912 length:303 start_codon:yes stop_codon:yes gene_type:complete